MIIKAPIHGRFCGKLKIATYNVNSIRSRLHIVLPWLKNNMPDIFCMQETKVDDNEFPAAEFEKVGYHVSFSGGKRYNGVAAASLAEPEGISFGFDDGKKPSIITGDSSQINGNDCFCAFCDGISEF